MTKTSTRLSLGSLGINGILFIVFLELLGIGLMVPLLPFVSQRFGAGELEVGFFFAIFPLFQTVVMPFWGSLSDRMGRRPVILMSVIGSTASYVLFAFSGSYTMLLVSRALGGAAGGTIAVAKAYLADLSKPDTLSRNMGLYGAAQGLGFLLGPVAGSLLSAHGVRWVGLSAAAISLISFLWVLMFVPESPMTTRVEGFSERLGVFARMKKRPVLARLFRDYFLIVLGFSPIFIAFPLYLQKEFGFGSQQTGYFFFLLAVVATVIQGGLFGKLARLRSENWIMRAGLIVLAFSFLALPPFRTVAASILMIVCIATGFSLANPAILSQLASVAGKDEQGEVSGISESMAGLARILGPILAGLVLKIWSPIAGFYLAGFFILLVLFLRRREAH